MDAENLQEIRKSRRSQGLEPLVPNLASLSQRRPGVREKVNSNAVDNNTVRRLCRETSDDDDVKSVVTVASYKSKMSIRSTASSQRSQIQRKQLQAEIDSMERVSKLQAELEEKRLERETEIEKKRLEMEKLVIEDEIDEFGDEKSVAIHNDIPKNDRVRNWLDDRCDEGKNPMAEAKLSLENQLAITNARLERMLTRHTVSKELPVFGGNSEEWPMFLRQYQRTTEICGLTADENMLRLQKALKGKAREAVLPVLGIPENVNAVMETLEIMFGRPDQIIETMVHKIRSTPPPKEGKSDGLISFSNQIANLVANMLLMNRTGHLTNPTLLNEVVTKLPYQLRFQWCSFSLLLKRDPNLADLADWMRGVAMTVSMMPPEVCLSENTNNINKTKKPVLMAVVKDEKSSCLCCGRTGHDVASCNKFLTSNAQTRWKLVKSKYLCYSCLSSTHKSFECKKKEKCGVDGCIRTHSKLLHKISEDGKTEGSSEAEANNKSGVDAKVETCGHVSLNHAMKEVLLRVIPVRLTGSRGEVHTFALLDEGSTVTMIDASFAAELQISGQKDPLYIQWTNELTKQESNSERLSLTVSGSAVGAKKYTLYDVRTVEKLSLPKQSIDMNMIQSNWPYLKGIPFESILNAQPKILIGSDNTLLIIPRKIRQGQWNDPLATKTWLGWVVHGNLVKPQRLDSHYSYHVCEGESKEEELLRIVRESFSTDAFGVKVSAKPLRSKEDERAWTILEKTTRRIGDRFETGLLWKSDKIHLPESKSNALRRLHCMEKKMDKDPMFADAYCNKIDEFLAKGYCHKMTTEEANKVGRKTYYLPHFAAFNPNKPDKLRLVFDAISRNHGISLNDCLLKGPDLLNPLPAVLMRFRIHRVGTLADIKEMFPQIKIIPEDQDCQRFLWRGKDRDRHPDVYIMTSMIFGAACSPASAQYVKNKNAMEFEAEFGQLSKAVVDDTYRDDLPHGGDSNVQAVENVEKFIELFRRGGFKICNWSSSSMEVIKRIPPEFRSKCLVELKASREFLIDRVLGLRWNAENDEFLFELMFHKVDEGVLLGQKIPSKRGVLRLVMSLFDPLGYVAHFVIKAKILFQQIWHSKIGWDDLLTPAQNNIWQLWILELQHITKVRVPRCYSTNVKIADSLQQHTFVDASQEAFAAVSYLRIKSGNLIEIAFFMGRARVAPTKPLSVPRLELQAAVMGARMAETIRSKIRLPIEEVHYWSDSRTVLCWIRSESRNYKQFVGHRIGEILESTEVKDWHWVPTEENAADDGTRSSNDSDLTPSSRWLTGPAFVKLGKHDWPVEPDLKEFVPPEEEMKKANVFLAFPLAKFSFPEVGRFSSWLKTIRTTAWCLRFLDNWKLSRKSCMKIKGELSLNELERAQGLWWKAVQRESFADDLVRLKSGMSLQGSSRLQTLSPFLDDDGVLRVRGRTEISDELGEDTKFPIILDPKHGYTQLLLQHYHEEGGHHGVETVLCSLRQKYWILQMRCAVKSIFHRCQRCKVFKAKPSPPLMGILPEERTQKQMNAFTYSGVDYFGPLKVTVGRHKEKRYGVLFTCLATRAIHLEIAHNLSTDATIMAIRRFVGRRGPIVR